jgi:hypothetical protein
VCSAFVRDRVFERVRANMHECSRKRVCGLLQEFRKHERGVAAAAGGCGRQLQKIIEYSYGLRGQRKWAFHRAYNLSMHHNTTTGPPWPVAEFDERFGWRCEVKGDMMVMQTAAPLPLPLLEHLHGMMRNRPRAERRMYECIAHVPHTPLLPLPLQSEVEGGEFPAMRDGSLGVSVGKSDFSIVEVKQNRRSKARFKRKSKVDRKFLTNADLASVCSSFGRAAVDEPRQAEDRASGAKVSVRAQLKHALLQLRAARDELRQLRQGDDSAESFTKSLDEHASHASGHAAASRSAASAVLSPPVGAKSGRVQYQALPHPLAIIPGTKHAASVIASSSLLCVNSKAAAPKPPFAAPQAKAAKSLRGLLISPSRAPTRLSATASLRKRAPPLRS